MPHDADQGEDLLVLLAQAAFEPFPDGLLEGVEAVDERADAAGLVVLQEPERRGLPVVEAAGAELGEGVFVGEAVGQALDELHRRPDGLLGGELLEGRGDRRSG